MRWVPRGTGQDAAPDSRSVESAKPIRLVEGDHQIDCRMDGMAIGLKACFVKKGNR